MPVHKNLVSRGLTPKQQAFVVEYVKDKNATQAAIRAGYKANNAESVASRLVSKSHVKVAIETELVKLCGTALTAAHVTAERVLREYARVGFADPRKLYDDKGNIKPVKELDDDTAAAIVSVEEEIEIELVPIQNPDGTDSGEIQKVPVRVRKAKLHSKTSALDSMADHLGLFKNGRGPNVAQVVLNINLGNQQVIVNGGNSTRAKS